MERANYSCCRTAPPRKRGVYALHPRDPVPLPAQASAVAQEAGPRALLPRLIAPEKNVISTGQNARIDRFSSRNQAFPGITLLCVAISNSLKRLAARDLQMSEAS